MAAVSARSAQPRYGHFQSRAETGGLDAASETPPTVSLKQVPVSVKQLGIICVAPTQITESNLRAGLGPRAGEARLGVKQFCFTKKSATDSRRGIGSIPRERILILALPPHPAHAGADIDAHALARGLRRSAGRNGRPTRLIEQTEQTFWNETGS
jgi:hypothetical protein